jgi:signal transduction histidine kinase
MNKIKNPENFSVEEYKNYLIRKIAIIINPIISLTILTIIIIYLFQRYWGQDLILVSVLFLISLLSFFLILKDKVTIASIILIFSSQLYLIIDSFLALFLYNNIGVHLFGNIMGFIVIHITASLFLGKKALIISSVISTVTIISLIFLSQDQSLIKSSIYIIMILIVVNISLIGFSFIKEKVFEKALRETGKSKASENRLRNSNKELSQFAHIISHELKNPLSTIISYLRILKNRNKNLDEKSDELALRIESKTKRMIELINNLLAYSKIISDENALEWIECDEIIKEIIEDLENKTRKKQVKFNIPESLPKIKANKIYFSILIQNFFDNAIKYNDKNKCIINFDVSENVDYWTFSINDNGIGIEPEYKDTVFVMFNRLHKDKYPGEGIGLSYCKKIVERHRGEIWLESEPGKYTTFYFTIKKNLKNLVSI